jgi:hypothetical protein
MCSRCLILACASLACSLKAVTVTTIAAGDWHNPNVWSTHQVPANPDSISVSHYITLSQDVTLSSPTILFITAQGTLCGDYLLETLCGANFINYGYMYLNRIKTRLGTNYNVIECKTSITVSGCSSPTAGFHSVPPDGSVKVWPPVLCNTINTNWEGGTSTAIEETEPFFLKLFPNPPIAENFTIVTESNTVFELTDVTGRVMRSGSFKNEMLITINGLPPGMYFIKLEREGKQRVEKILKAD